MGEERERGGERGKEERIVEKGFMRGKGRKREREGRERERERRKSSREKVMRGKLGKRR